MLEVGEGAAHHLRYALDHIDQAGPLGYALVVGHGLEVRVNALARAGIAAGYGEERHGVRVALRHTTEGVFGAGAGLHREDANLVAVVYTAVAVGHVDARALLPAEDRANAFLGSLVYQRLRRKARKPFHAFGLENLHDSLVTVHALLLGMSVCQWSVIGR